MNDENKPQTPQVVTSEVAAPDEVINAIRNEIPVGVAGTPIDRIPYNPDLAAAARSGSPTKRIASTDRCIRVVEVPVKGGGTAQYHCSRACVSVGDMRLCPDHDKAAFQPNQTPHGTVGRTLNAASVPLTKGEKDELTEISKSYAARGDNPLPSIRPTRDAAPAQQNSLPAAQPTPGVVKVELALDYLNAATDIRAAFAKAVCDALDELPAGNMREMKQIVALQEKITKLFLAPKGGKRHVRRVKVDSTPKASI